MATFALLGCTHPHSRMHLATLRLAPEVRRVILWDPEPAAAEALAPHAGVKFARATDDLPSALGEEVEFALVCRRNDETPDAIVAAARAGKHVLSEKPTATTAARLRPVLREVREAGVALGVCYPWRCHPAAVELRRLIGEGTLGLPLAVEARMVTSQVRFRDPGHWLFTRQHGGGGILHWLGCHFFDLLRFLLQDEVTEVRALAATLSGQPIEVEDTAAVAMRWRSGALGTFAAGYHLPRSAAGYSGASYDTYLAVRGLDGNFRWEPTRAEETVRVESVREDWAGAPEREFRYRLEPSEAYAGRYGLEFLRLFVANARAGVPQVAGGEDALRVLEWLDAVYEAAAGGD
jgi:predicted dehydrogenase